MIGVNTDHCGIVNECLQGQRSWDDQALNSVAVLQERLEGLKRTHGMFAGVSLSPHVETVSHCSVASA